MTPAEAYDEIARLAVEHALVAHAAGGVLIVMHPDTQRETGHYERIQWVHGLGPHPRQAEIDMLIGRVPA